MDTMKRVFFIFHLLLLFICLQAQEHISLTDGNKTKDIECRSGDFLCTFALEIAWGGTENRQEKFRKLRRKTEEITWKSRGNRQEKFRKSHGKVSTLSGQRCDAVTL